MLRILLVVCPVLVGLTGVQSANTTAGCGSNPADIVFLLDSSGSVGTTNFQKQKDFVARFAQSFDIGTRNVQIGAVTFASTPHNEFNLNTHTNKNDLVSAIRKIGYHSGGTRTDLALKYVAANSFKTASGDRAGVANILIVMTDGKSNQPTLTVQEANKLHQQNIKVFAIGIGSGADRNELGHIATDAKHVFQVQNFDALSTLQAELKKTACTVDGGWTKWGSYSPCTKSCGSGTHFRERSCTNPRPANGGKQCVGSARESHSCNTKACPTTPAPTTTTTPKTTPMPTSPTTLAAGCNGTEPADILFILDASGSVGRTNFNLMLNFVKKLVDGFPVSAKETQIGVITFDSKVYLQFHLNKFHDKNAIKTAVSNVRYTSGSTHTSDALKYARETAFKTQNGMRPNAAKIAIVITDGQSSSASATSSEAAKLRAAGVTIFSIGVGSGAKLSELNAMATDPDKTHVFTVTNFASLNTIKAGLAQKTCEVKATTIAPTTPKPKSQCNAQADIVFLLDSSGSVGSTNFRKMLGFVNNVANGFNIGPQDVQIGVDTFQTGHKAEFNLNTYSSKQPMLAAINNIKYTQGLTHTGEAIRFMRTDSFKAAHGDRPNVPNVAIIVTDGQSNNAALTASEAKKARDAGITVLAIGVGSGARKSELNAMATDPDSTHVYTADNFDALGSLQALLSSKACEVSKPEPNNTAPTCAAKADIAFILDSSGSIGQTNYNKMLDFVKDVVNQFDIGSNKIRVATEIFSDRTYVQFNFNKYMTKAPLTQAISNIPYKRGTTNTGQALKDANNKLFKAANGDRAGVPNIAIVVTDGRSTNRPSTIAEAKKLRDSGVQVFAVGVGSGIDKSELNAIATNPDSTHVLTVKDFNQLTQITAQLNNKACAAIPPSPQTAVPSQAPTLAPDPCQDQNPNCGNFEIPAVCSDYAAWARDNCQRSCKFCTPSIPTTPPPCVDRIQNCNEYDVSVCTGDYKGWAQDNCRKYCGFCNLKSPSQVLTGFFGACYYQGKQYSQGQTWDDGCSYECTCDDAAHGRYSCYNKCPVYYNLPPQCSLVKKGNACCLEPVCDFKGTYGTTNGQNVGKYNGVNVCMYKGQPYYQGQTWQDGCEYNCFCQDGEIGLWTCSSVCSTYGTLPPECHLEKAAGKCCAEPTCDFSKQFGSFTGAGSTSGSGSGVNTLTTPGPCVDKDANCAGYQKDTCTNPQYSQWAHEQCKKFCGFCNAVPTPGPNDKCVYNGVAYSQGQRWDDGCDLECVCENAIYGFYRCNKKCADVTNLPLGCSQVKKAGECCPTVQCSAGQTGTFQGSQTQPGTIGGYPVPQPKPSVAPTPGPGLTYAPGLAPSLAPNLVVNSLEGCLYKGTLHQTGMRWNDGCDFTCVCSDGKTGQYRCSPKCPSFGTLPKECQLQDNPSDPCCQQPVCTPGANGTLSSVPVPSYGKGFTGYGPPSTPTIGGSGVPTVNPNIPSPTGPAGSGCTYKNKVYRQGQQWDDGCTYKCECLDATSGQYRCTDRCPSYQNVPAQCTLQPDPTDTCCKVLQCGSLASVTTPPPLFAQTTPPSGSAYCEYQGYYHRQGESWNDGCGLTCRCEDAANHYYQCTDRCPKYDNVPISCSFVPDPKDPACCRVPSCQGTTGGTSGTGIPQGFTGSLTGYGRPPTIDPNSLANTGYRSACLYKGKVHQQGDTWQDGCDYECECTDASRGQYKCNERCQRIASVPTGCRFEVDPNDSCCQKLRCDPTAALGTCTDKVNCAQYGAYVCGSTYQDWATQNCAKYCGICGGGSGPVTTPASTGPCKNAIPDCDQYGQSACVGQYLPWAKANCPVYCNLCNTGTGTGTGTAPGTGTGTAPGTGTSGTGTAPGTGTGTAPGTGTSGTGTAPGTGTGGTGTGTSGTGPTGTGTGPTGPCTDVLSNCPEYSQNACHEPYVDWAKTNCRSYCGYCDQTGGTGTGTGTGGTGTGTGTGGTGTGTGTGGPGTGGTGTGTGTGFGGSGIATQAPGSGFTGFSGGCVYKGRYYPAGDTWRDGCDYNCTCENGQTGFFRCVDQCPTYGELPAGCVLKKPAGECCGKPDCSGLAVGPGTGTGTGTGGTGTETGTGGTGTGTGGPGTGTGTGGTGTGGTGSATGTGTGSSGLQTGTQPGCYYKNQLYQQGQSWKDGCTYKCTCVNGATHQYQCQGLCLNWQLPSTCTLDPPAAGKCCKTPNCPSNVVLNYPPGYTAE